MMALLHLLSILFGLLLLNELFRKSRWFTVGFFVVLPVLMTILVWIPRAAEPGSSTNTWFHWVKLYSVIAAVIGFTLMRYSRLGQSALMKFFPALILAINIAEAVGRDVELGLATGGIWHFLNATAGVLSIVTLSGWSGITIEDRDKRDLLWPDMTLFWIIAYDIWNFVYIWNCVPEHAAYGFAVLTACTIPSVFIKKGTWIQARAFTLATWMMYIFTFTAFADTPSNNILLPRHPALLTFMGSLSLLLNGAFAAIHFSKMIKQRSFGFGEPVHAEPILLENQPSLR